MSRKSTCLNERRHMEVEAVKVRSEQKIINNLTNMIE